MSYKFNYVFFLVVLTILGPIKVKLLERFGVRNFFSYVFIVYI